jgi:hypothetical protein
MIQYSAIRQDGFELQAPLQTIPDALNNISLADQDQQPAVAVSRAYSENVQEDQLHQIKTGTKANPWIPGLWKRFPWARVGSILLIICRMLSLAIRAFVYPKTFFLSFTTPNLLHPVTAAALGVLIVSNYTHVDRWRVGGTTIQPQVWLSVLTTIMDGLMVFVLVGGGTTYFWRQAFHGIKVRIL